MVDVRPGWKSSPTSVLCASSLHSPQNQSPTSGAVWASPRPPPPIPSKTLRNISLLRQKPSTWAL
ncbi:unnamed protein product [Dibothriocephalus latus]|uniref:Uncharacterized protein n=1 Tax=Dibothriocephalus latus TaxID=60516 RepID=A0A3P7RFA2_DIBLA|nr:unnamed protein product [Dibothriocephalus latus]